MLAGAELQAAGDVVTAIVDWLPLLLGIVAILAGMLWVLAYATRLFEYLKMQESRWLDRGTLDFVHRVLASIWVAFTVIVALVLLSFRSSFVRDLLYATIRRVPAAFVVLFVLFTAIVMTRVLHRFSAYLRGELRVKPRQAVVSRALSVTELVTKYAIYLVAAGTAVVGGAQALPPEDQYVKDVVAAFVAPAKWGQSAIVLLVADRFAAALFGDLRRRSRRFNPHVVDRLQTASRVALVLIVASTALFLILAIVGLSSEQLLLAAVGYLAILLTTAFVLSESVRDALSGITLMMADPFEVGERVKVGDLVGDIVAVNLTHTQIRTLRGDLVHLPNSRLLHETIVNFSRSTTHSVVVEVGVEFNVPHDQVEAILRGAATSTPGIDTNPAPEVYGKDLADGCLHYQLIAFTKQPERMKEIRSDLIFRIQESFRRDGVQPRAPC